MYIWYLYINNVKQNKFVIVASKQFNDGYWIASTHSTIPYKGQLTEVRSYDERFNTLYKAKQFVLHQTYGQCT